MARGLGVREMTTETTAEEALQRSSEEFLRALGAIAAMEEEKKALDPDDPRRQELAARIEERTLELFARSQHQTRLVAEAAPDEPAPPRPAQVVLADWRDAERRLHEARLAARRASIDSGAFMEEYQRSMALLGNDGGDGRA